jgi:hypothetical protein
MDEPIKIQLKQPIPYGDGTLPILSLRRPKAGDFRGLKGGDKPFDMVLDLAARLAGLSPAVIDRVDVDDLPRLAEVVNGFLSGFQEIGKT